MVKIDPERYHKLFQQLLDGKLSPQDAGILLGWLDSKELDSTAAELIMRQLKQSVQADQISPLVTNNLEKRLQIILAPPKSTPLVSIFRFRKNPWLRYAAIFILLFSGIGIYFQFRHKQIPSIPNTIVSSAKSDIAPGKEGAILTLDDGRMMVLDNLENRFIANQNGSKVVLKNGQLVYAANNISEANKLVYNIISTPKGRQFQLRLCDGTKVWLNAASSLRYPTAFVGNDRRVEVTGEAYFEVAKNPRMPFHVKINDRQEVEVLGTHFNINAYENENAVHTTLIEGSVRFYNGSEKVILKPGQQAKVPTTVNAPIKINDDVDIDKVMAWKNGVFDFDNATLEQVMRQLERWYDIDVVYEKGAPPFEFVGKIQKNLNLSEVLHGLEVSNVHFRLEGRKLIVLP